MPKYVYHCNKCNSDFEIVHGMTERQDECVICSNSSCLRRIPQMPSIKTSNYKVDDEHKSAGDRVKQAISDNAEILKEQIKEATSWEYEP